MNEMLMGIENEFTLKSKRNDQMIDRLAYFSLMKDRIDIPYFENDHTILVSSTGGDFYLDGDSPEITTAPYVVEKGAVTAVITNLVMGRNAVVKASDRVNEERSGYPPCHLEGYSAHYNFSFPEMGECNEQSNICRLLSTTVNPAIQILVENKKSSGVMFRNREDGRFEICGDYIPSVTDMIAAVGFQAAMFSTIRSWVAKGMNSVQLGELLKYDLDLTPLTVSCRLGYFVSVPEVIKKGRCAKVKVIDYSDYSGHVVTKTAQDLLLHYAGIFEEGMDAVLTKKEKKIVMDSVSHKRNLPIDGEHYPRGYLNVRPVTVDESVADAPLKTALTNSIYDRVLLPDLMLRPYEVSYAAVSYEVLSKKDSEDIYAGTITIPRNHLLQFEKLLAEEPSVIKKIVSGKLSDANRQMLSAFGLEEKIIDSWDLSRRFSDWGDSE